MSLALDLGKAFRKQLSTTPGYLAGLLVTLCAATLILFIVACVAAAEQKSAMKTVCIDAAPSIVAAQHIKAALADLDANAANELLFPPSQTSDAAKAYDARRQEISDNLVTAAQNITYGDTERGPILTIENQLAAYESWITRARALHEANNPAALTAYDSATQIMHQKLLPAADALDKANFDVLAASYNAQQRQASTLLFLVLALGVVVLAILVYTQFYLIQRTRRLLNRGLLVSTVVLLVFLGMSWRDFREGGHELYVAKEQAFDSIKALWTARALAYDANGAESRWLVARVDNNAVDVQRYDAEFLDKSMHIAKLSEGMTVPRVVDAYKQGKKPNGFTGLLADELNNITFRGEMDAALAAFQKFEAYVDVDVKIRSLEQNGQHAEAVALCTGKKPGESNFVFDEFDKALGQTIDINQKAFEAACSSGMARFAWFDSTAAAVLLVVCITAWLGLRPRFAEYALG